MHSVVVLPPSSGRLPPCVKPLHSPRCWPGEPTHNGSLSRGWDVPNGIGVQLVERLAPIHEAGDTNPRLVRNGIPISAISPGTWSLITATRPQELERYRKLLTHEW